MIEYVMLMDTKRVKKIMKEIIKKIGIKKRNGMRMKMIGVKAMNSQFLFLIKHLIRYTLGQKSYHSSNSESTSTNVLIGDPSCLKK